MATDLTNTDGAGASGARRRYRKRRRAAQEAATRERITEAAVKLHSTVGPARTTVTGIAREAGVQRATVYRHFPDEVALFEACSTHFMAQNPPPAIERWAAIADPGERLREALSELYAWYERTGDMFERTTRDRALVPAMDGAVERSLTYLEAAGAALMEGRPQRGRPRALIAAAIAHALTFPTWRSLRREQGLDAEAAITLMAGMVDAAAARPGR